ncbi:oligosaccharide flippase family protein [Treponema sp. Marseille-Q4130]|uniref:oligosaccharide flippase family protein n=1 Tax=Treponema sp. Marseille-Q4130 TaxID=2766702 RepID=UPI0016522439|nr:oligosaccharide flippase family protein [Treponema sp. Marseille-Q4130]MBC6719339.1 oligosaccharide flippase family protein [Treponema sp. Marseille-Q4130]
MTQKSLKKNAFYNFIRSFMNLAFPIISFPYASRILMPDGIGKINFANSVIDYLVMLAGLGISSYAAREAAKIRDDPFKLNKFSREILLINGVSTIIAYILFAVSLLCIRKFHDYQILLIVCSSKILFITMGLEWLYAVEEEYRYITLRSAFFQIVSLAFLFIFVRSKNDYVAYAVMGIISNAGMNVCNIVYARKFINIFEKTTLEIKKHIKPISVFFGMVCAVKIHSAMDTVMLGFMMDDSSVGYYTAASKIRRLVVQMITAITGTLLPRSSYYIELGQMQKYDDMVKKAIGVVSFFSFPATAGLIVIGKPLITVFSGVQYLPALPVLYCMAPIIIAVSFASFLNNVILTPNRKERFILYSQIFGTILNIVLNYIFIPLWGVFGAGISTLIVEFSITVIQLFCSFSHLKKLLSYLGKQILQSAIGTIAMYVSVCFLIKIIPSALLQIAAGLATGSAIYAAVEILLQNDTAKLLLASVSRRIHKR